jgi:hypothetical protein
LSVIRVFNFNWEFANDFSVRQNFFD